MLNFGLYNVIAPIVALTAVGGSRAEFTIADPIVTTLVFHALDSSLVADLQPPLDLAANPNPTLNFAANPNPAPDPRTDP